MSFMRVLQLAIHQVIHMIPVGNSLVSAARTMHVPLRAHRQAAPVRIVRGHRDYRLVHMIPVRHMQMAIVQVGDLGPHPDGRVPATLSMNVGVSAVNPVVGPHSLTSV